VPQGNGTHGTHETDGTGRAVRRRGWQVRLSGSLALPWGGPGLMGSQARCLCHQAGRQRRRPPEGGTTYTSSGWLGPVRSPALTRLFALSMVWWDRWVERLGWQARPSQFVRGTRGSSSRVTRHASGRRGGRGGSAGASPSRAVLSAVGWQARPNKFERGTRGRHHASGVRRQASGRRGWQVRLSGSFALPWRAECGGVAGTPKQV